MQYFNCPIVCNTGSSADGISLSSGSETPQHEPRPKTAFQRLNNKFEQVLAELKQVHLRTQKPKSLPPIIPVSTTPIIEVESSVKRYYQTIVPVHLVDHDIPRNGFVRGFDDRISRNGRVSDLPDVILI